ncbi:Uncharacterised protein [Mycobacteroides abscessus subsp. abscessus]|nr:Uncharacterised protein [Mycobacteroides abscessus subsp. abscessus]
MHKPAGDGMVQARRTPSENRNSLQQRREPADIGSHGAQHHLAQISQGCEHPNTECRNQHAPQRGDCEHRCGTATAASHLTRYRAHVRARQCRHQATEARDKKADETGGNTRGQRHADAMPVTQHSHRYRPEPGEHHRAR